MSTLAAFEEQHYTVKQLAQLWGKSYETIRQIVATEPGVLKFSGGKGKHMSYSVPASVAKRIHTRMTST